MRAKVELDLFGQPVEVITKSTVKKVSDTPKPIEVADLPHTFKVRPIESTYREILPDRSYLTTIWH